MTNGERGRTHRVCKRVKWNVSRLPLRACLRGSVWIDRWSVSRLRAARYRWQPDVALVSRQLSYDTIPFLNHAEKCVYAHWHVQISEPFPIIRLTLLYCVTRIHPDTLTASKVSEEIMEIRLLFFPWKQTGDIPRHADADRLPHLVTWTS